MGVMSKTSRLPERPKPPSWIQVTEDVTTAAESDVVFKMGEESLGALEGVPLPSPQDKTNSSTSTSSEGNNTSQETADIETEKIKASNADVTNLISVYNELTSSVDSLQDACKRLNYLDGELSQSAKELKVLAESVSAEVCEKIGAASSDDKSLSRGKPRQKKKK